MSTKEGQNVWFGVAMFLLGLVIGIILMIVSGVSLSNPLGKKAGTVPAPQGQEPAVQLSAEDQMLAIIKTIGLSEDAFAACTKDDGGAIAQRINQVMAGGQQAGVSGTPGNIIYSKKAKQGRLVPGARPLSMFKRHIDAMLANPSAKFVADPAEQADNGVSVTTNVLPIDPATEFVRGDAKADIVLIEYSDYECPFCRRVHPTIEQLMKDYDGKIAWVFRHYPLPPTMHPDAMTFSIGAECAATLGGADAFWQFTDAIMTSN